MGVEDRGCGPTGFIVTFGVVGVSGAVIFVTLLRLVEEFFEVLGVVGVAGACTSCGGVDVKLESSLQCLNLRGADVSTRSTSDPDDSLSHSEHCHPISFVFLGIRERGGLRQDK